MELSLPRTSLAKQNLYALTLGTSFSLCVLWVLANSILRIGAPLEGEDLMFARLSGLPAIRFYELFSPHVGFFYRPTILVFFQMMGKVFGVSPVPYHVVGILLHALFAWLCGLLTWRLSRSVAASAVTLAVFLLQPNMETVYLWPAAYSGAFAAVGTMVALHAWLSSRRGAGWGWPLAVGAFVFAICSKQESVAVVPGIIALDVIIFRPPLKRALLNYAPFVIVCLAMLPLQVIAKHAATEHPAWFFGNYGDRIASYASGKEQGQTLWARFNNIPRCWSAMTWNILPVSGWTTLALVLGALGALVRKWQTEDVRRSAWALVAVLASSAPMQLVAGVAHWNETRLIYLTLGFVSILGGLVADALWQKERGILGIAFLVWLTPHLPWMQDLFLSWGLCAAACLFFAVLVRDKRVPASDLGLVLLSTMAFISPFLFDVNPLMVLGAGLLAALAMDRTKGPGVFLLSMGAPWAVVGLLAKTEEERKAKLNPAFLPDVT